MKKQFRKNKNKVPLTNKQTKAVAKIASKVFNKVAEKKSYISPAHTHSPLDGTWVVRNLFFPLSQGDTASTYTGKKIDVSHITFNVSLTQGHLSSLDDRNARVMVFASREEYTTSATTLTGSQIMRTPLPANTSLQQIDYAKIQKLYDAKIKLIPRVATTSNAPGRIWKTMTFRIPIKKVLQFTEDNSGRLKNRQYYIAFTGYDNSLTLSPVQYDFQYQINFRDD